MSHYSSEMILNASNEGYYRGLIYSFLKFFNRNRYEPLTKDLYIALYIYLKQEHDKEDVLYWMNELVVAEKDRVWFNTLINDYKAIENYEY